ncbi:Amidase 1 [Exophiala dermatitidis]
MSTQGPPSPQGGDSNKVAKRRANSCVPCRKKRDKPRCWYRNVVSKDDEDSEPKTSPLVLQKEGSQSTLQQDTEDTDDEDIFPWPHRKFFGAFSLARCVDKFKSLSAADTPSEDTISSIQTVEVFNCRFNDEEKLKILDKALQASSPTRTNLRSLLIPEPDRRLSGRLRALYYRFLEAHQHLDAGMVVEAWCALGSLLRDAQTLGLDEDDGSNTVTDRQTDREAGRRVWWLLIDFDAKLSFILGRRPLISPSHGVPRPTVDCPRKEERDLMLNILDFTQYMQEVLNDILPEKFPGKAELDVDKATLESHLARLQELHSKFSYLPQNGKTDPPLWAAIAEHQYKIQLFLMVLNSQIVMSIALGGRSSKKSEKSEGQTPSSTASSTKSKRPQPLRKHSSKGYLEEMFQAVRRITSLFEYINALDSAPTPPWPRCFGVYCAASLLGIARLRQDIDHIQTDMDRLQDILKFFQGSLRRSPRSAIAQAAVMSLGAIVERVLRPFDQHQPNTAADGTVQTQDGLSQSFNDENTQTPQSRSFANQAPVDNSNPMQQHQHHLKRPQAFQYEAEVRPEKRMRYSAIPPNYENTMHGNPPAWERGQGPPPYAQPMSSFSEMSAASFHEASMQHSLEQASFAHSAPTSFSASDQMQYAAMSYSSGRPDNGSQLHSFPFWMHPPMLIHPPMYHAGWQAMDPSTWMVPDTSQPGFYGGPPTMSVNDPHPHDGNMQLSQQSANMNSFCQGGPTRDDGPQAGNMTVPMDNGRGAPDGQFYTTSSGQYQHLDKHPASSALKDDGLSRQDNGYGRAPPMDRRRSAADIRSQQQQNHNNAWPMEMRADYANQHSMGEQQRDTPQGGDSQTASRDGLLSPVSETESKSRRNSATPRQIARKGRPPPPPLPPAPQHVDAGAPQGMDAGGINNMRRHSIAQARANDMMIADVASGRDPRAEPSDMRPEQQQQQQPQPMWQNQPQQQPPNHGPPGHPVDARLYSMEMAGHPMQYEQQYEQHLPPRPVVTTGPFTGNTSGHQWWPRQVYAYYTMFAIKQRQRDARFESLPETYRGPLTSQQRSILKAPIASLVEDVHNSVLSPIDIIRTYGKTATIAQQRTNCVTEVLLPEAEAWAKNEKDVNLKGPLAGIPVSLKDSIVVGGFDTSVGYSKNVFKPYPEDGIMVKLLKRAGAIPHVKTALPITLLSFESTNDLWGVCKNPHNPKYSPGGSTGGEGALLALNGSRIGIGSDVAGSVRAPAAWSGINSLRCSTGRWPKMGMNTSMPGQEGIPSVFSPMARTLDDLTYFTKSFIGMKPWEVDYTVHPIPWRQDIYDSTLAKDTKLRIGLMMSDGVVRPSPAIARTLKLSADALRAQGHEIVDINVSDFPATATPALGLQIASVLLCGDGGKTFRSFFRTGESNDPGAAQINFYMALPRPIKYLWYLWTRYVKRDPLWASLLRYFHPLSAVENWKWVAKREAFRATWFDWWEQPKQQFDFILCPANATPALPHRAMHDAVSSCGYTFLWNLLDYSAGIVPVSKVDAELDKLSPTFRPVNGVERGAYKLYKARDMAGLPTAVQVVGRRLTEEKVLAAMKVVEDSLREKGVVYEHIDVESLPEFVAQEANKLKTNTTSAST